MPVVSAHAEKSRVEITWTLSADPNAVWDALTRPSLLKQWLGDVTDGEVTAGSEFTIAHSPDDLCRSAITSFNHLKTLAYSWDFTGEPPSHVEWTLEPSSVGTALRLSHTGLERVADSYCCGWLTHLLYLEGCAAGTPLPWGLFESVHSTVNHSNRP